MVDFKQLLKTPKDQVERPKAAPGGTYHGHVVKYAFDKRSKYGEDPNVKYDIVVFNVMLTGPTDDVDPDQLEGVDLQKISRNPRLTREYFITPADVYRLYDLVESFGHDPSGRGVDDFLPELVGASALITLSKTASKDGKDWYNNIRDLRGA